MVYLYSVCMDSIEAYQRIVLCSSQPFRVVAYVESAKNGSSHILTNDDNMVE